MAYTVHAHTEHASFELTLTADSIEAARAQAEYMFCGPNTKIFVALSRD